jgi:hypothetical protein
MPRKFVMEPEVDANEFARGLGAKPVGERSDGSLDILDVRHTLQTMVRSSGGRPSLAISEGQTKIPRIASDWQIIEELSASLQEGGPKLPLGQIAAVVLHLGLAQIERAEIQKALLASSSRIAQYGSIPPPDASTLGDNVLGVSRR